MALCARVPVAGLRPRMEVKCRHRAIRFDIVLPGGTFRVWINKRNTRLTLISVKHVRAIVKMNLYNGCLPFFYRLLPMPVLN